MSVSKYTKLDIFLRSVCVIKKVYLLKRKHEVNVYFIIICIVFYFTGIFDS